MITDRARRMLQAAAVAATLVLAPITAHTQSADSANATQSNYGTTRTGRGFNWGWLGLLGLLGLWPKGRKEVTTTETRNTTTSGTGNRY